MAADQTSDPEGRAGRPHANETAPTPVRPEDFIAGVEPEGRREDARVLLDLFRA